MTLLFQLICPTIIFISVFYPFYRGLRQICWWKSVLLGWGFFLLGCVFHQYLTPLIAGYFLGSSARAELECINSYMFAGIALGWFFPLIFHYLGVCTTRTLYKRKLNTASNGKN